MVHSKGCKCPDCTLDKIIHKPRKAPMCPKCQTRHRENDQGACIRNLLMKYGGTTTGSPSTILTSSAIKKAYERLMKDTWNKKTQRQWILELGMKIVKDEMGEWATIVGDTTY